MVTINIGLYAAGCPTLVSPRLVLWALRQQGVAVLRYVVKPSSTEPTFVGELGRPLTREEGYRLSVLLCQEAIAQQADGQGELLGPMAKEWGPFDPNLFLTFTEGEESWEC